MEQIRRLEEIIGRTGAVISDPEIMRSSCQDWRGWYAGEALALLRPKSVEEVRRIVVACNDMQIRITPQAGNSSLVGGSVPLSDGKSVVLSTSGIDNIREIDPAAWSITAEAGATLSKLQQAAASHDRHFGVDLGARDTARLGGLVSTNAGGMSVLRYGSMREQVLGLEVVLPDGSLWNGLLNLRKNNSGPDLKHMFIGAEGTLGVVTAATLRLHPPERNSATLLLALRDFEAINEVADALLHTGVLSSLELMPRWAMEIACREVVKCAMPMQTEAGWLIQARVAGLLPVMEQAEKLAEHLFEASLIGDAVLVGAGAREDQLWTIRDAFSPVHNWLGRSVRFDLSVPLGAIPRLISSLECALKEVDGDLRTFAFGHLGDGNLHFSVFARPGLDHDLVADRAELIEQRVNEIAWAMGGSISAEHGIGQLHREHLLHQKSAEEVSLQRRLKSMLDPLGLFNPGKLFARDA